ncbi:MAG: hypothetical protein FWF67_02190, partial [Fibromonadales bacterium]|nr:hypothetical protein [Fibromonadales bacterium]
MPVVKSIPQGKLDPLCVFKILKNLSRQCFILESLEDKEKWGRYTFLGYDPKMEISCLNGKLTIKNGTNIDITTDNPGEYINRIIEDNKAPKIEGLPPFTGGLVGYFSYDYIKYSEPSLNLNAQDNEHFKDVDLMLFEKIVAFDLLKQEIILISNIKTDNLEENKHRALS